jgi:DNA-binding CsgD family transcriptional regulator
VAKGVRGLAGLECTGLFIDLSDLSAPALRAHGGADPAAVSADVRRLVASWPAASARGFLRRLFTGARCFTVSTRLDEKLYRTWARPAHEPGAQDALCVVACPQPGVGVLLWFPLPARTRLPRNSRREWEKMAAEILCALRLRGAAADDASPQSSRIPIPRNESEAMGTSEKPNELRQAVRTHWTSPDEVPALLSSAAAAFRGELLEGKWRLVDHYERDGRHYFLWDKNDGGTERARGLTEREREVLGRVAAGLGDRAIALELDCSPSTVATHRLRAMSKLGIDSRTLLAQILAGIGVHKE